MKRTNTTKGLLVLFACTVIAQPNQASADSEKEVHDFWINAVLRNEQVDQDNVLRDANAVTLRTRVGYEYSGVPNFGLLAEVENITALDDSYNSTTNGRVNRSVVPDPEDTELNRLVATYTGFADTSVQVGRQRIVFDNARFIGNVGWRQNEQTFDAAMVTHELSEETTVRVGYIDKVRRIFGPDSPIGTTDMQSPIVHVNYRGLSNSTLTAYGYFLDFEDAPSTSNRTLGIRWVGSRQLNEAVTLKHQLEFADQADYSGGAGTIDAHYIHANVVAAFDRFSVGVGHELLSGDGSYAFQTPLATGHAFNGWSDQFLVTPTDGLQDTYIQAGVKFFGVNLRTFYHEFRADNGSDDYGSEINAIATRKFGDSFLAGLKFADYQADARGVDTTKLWLYLQFNH